MLFDRADADPFFLRNPALRDAFQTEAAEDDLGAFAERGPGLLDAA